MMVKRRRSERLKIKNTLNKRHGLWIYNVIPPDLIKIKLDQSLKVHQMQYNWAETFHSRGNLNQLMK